MNILAINQFEDILLESAFGILVVFTALTLLVIAFLITGKISKQSIKLRKKKSAQQAVIEEHEKDLTGEEIAAISMALHLFISEVHDDESNVITIKRIERRYSPWSSKIYGMTNLNR